MSTEKRHGKTLHRVDRIKLPGIYMNPQSFPQQSMRNLAYVEFIKTRGLQSLSVILWVSAPPNQIPCELFPAILTEFLFNLSLSSPCGSAVHSSKVIYIKVIFEYKSYLYTVYTHNIYDQFKIISVCYWEVNLLHGLICFYTLLYRSVHAFTHVCIYHMYINRILNFFNSWGFF